MPAENEYNSTFGSFVEAVRAATIAGLGFHEEQPAEDEWVRCSGLHCPNAERFAKAAERGWQTGGMGTWQCPNCAPGAES